MSKTLERLPVLCYGCSSRGSIGTRRRDFRPVFFLLPDLSQVDGTAIAQDISVERCVAFVLRDRDRIFGYEFVQQLTAMGVAICLDHVIVFNEAILAGETSRHLQSFGSRIIAAEATWAYRRTPDPRPVKPPGPGRIIASREVSGLNYRYELRASCRLIDPCL